MYTSNGPQSTEELFEDGKPMMHDGIRRWEKGKLDLLGREWWLRGYRLSSVRMTEAMPKGCKWAWQRWLKRESVEQQ